MINLRDISNEYAHQAVLDRRKELLVVINNTLLYHENTGISMGRLFKLWNRGSYKTFQRDIRALTAEGKIRGLKAQCEQGRTTLVMKA